MNLPLPSQSTVAVTNATVTDADVSVVSVAVADACPAVVVVACADTVVIAVAVAVAGAVAGTCNYLRRKTIACRKSESSNPSRYKIISIALLVCIFNHFAVRVCMIDVDAFFF